MDKRREKRDKRELAECSKKAEDEFQHKTKEDVLKQIFSRVFVGNQVICIKGRRKTGKTTLLMEIMAQNLLSNPDNQVLFLSTFGSFNAKKLFGICESYIEKDSLKDVNDSVKEIMQRIKVVQIETEVDFHDYFQCLDAMIHGVSKLALVVIDSLSFYHHDAYVYWCAKIRNPPLTSDFYMNYYLNIFTRLVKQYNVTILYTLPPNLVVEYGYSADFNVGEMCAHENYVQRHMIKKTDAHVPEFIYAVSNEDNDSNIPQRKQEENETLIVDICQSPELPSNLLAKIDYSDSEPGPSGINKSFGVKKSVSSLEIKKSSSDLLGSETGENISSQGSYQKIATQFLSIENDSSFSDSGSVQSGEGYKQESEADTNEQLNTPLEKISEKTLKRLFKFCEPDVIITLTSLVNSSYMMQIRKDNEDIDINYDITKDGIEWDYIPAEKN